MRAQPHTHASARAHADTYTDISMAASAPEAPAAIRRLLERIEEHPSGARAEFTSDLAANPPHPLTCNCDHHEHNLASPPC